MCPCESNRRYVATDDSSKQKPNTAKLLYWEYDNHSIASVLRNSRKTKYHDTKMHKDKSSFKEYRREQEKKISPAQKIQTEKIDIPTGLNYFRKKSISKKEMQDAFQNMELMIDQFHSPSAKNPDFFLLFSSILSGYVIRSIYKHTDLKCSFACNRAPIVQIKPSTHYPVGGYDELEQIARSLIVDVSNERKLYPTMPPILPPAHALYELNKCAYIKLKRKGDPFPAQYRDTSVLIHRVFFSSKDLCEFVERNRWATCILFGNPKKCSAHFQFLVKWIRFVQRIISGIGIAILFAD